MKIIDYLNIVFGALLLGMLFVVLGQDHSKATKLILILVSFSSIFIISKSVEKI